MTVVHCPCCRDEVTVPAKASPRALVRCPLCLEEYRLSEALAELPPTLIVVDGSVAEEEEALVGAGAAEAGGGYQLAGGGGGYGSAGVFDSSAPADAAVAPARPLRGKIRKKKEKSALLEIVKVVVGGIVGVTLAPIVLWWAFSKDPFELGPKVSPFAPWAVPAKFHGKPKSVVDDKTASSGGANNSFGQGQGLTVDPNLQAALNNPPKSKPKQKPKPTPAPQDQLIGELDPLGNPVTPMPSGLEIPSLDPNPTPQPMPTPMPTPPEPVSVSPPTPTPVPTPAGKPLPTAEDFQKAVLAAADSLTKVNDSTGQPPDVRKQLFTDMYLAASEVGRAISHLSPSDPDLYDTVQTLQTFLTSLISSNKVAAMKSLTDLQLPLRKHDDGAFLVGTVADFKAVGPLFECQIQAGKSGVPATILCDKNPQDFCKIGDELIVIGRMIDEPQKNLPGYEGSAEKLVYYGFHVAVPKTGSE